LCSVGDKDRGSSLQEEGSHTYTLRLSYSINSILYKIKSIVGKGYTLRLG